MRKEPITTTELFNTVTERLQNKDKLPDILDYSLATRDSVPIKTENFCIKNNLDYGGSEGIYLDLSAEVYDGERFAMHELGTFKTLDESDEAMEKMGALLGSFISEVSAYVSENGDDMEWEGFAVRPVGKDGKRRCGIYVTSLAAAKEAALKYMGKYDSISICDYEGRKERIYCDREAVEAL